MKTAQTYTVSQINQILSNVTENTFKRVVWIEGEVTDYKERSHIYFQLIEKEYNLNSIKASIKAIIFANEKEPILRNVHSKSPGFKLQNGLKVKVLCKVSFYRERAYASLRVKEIDPFYTVGNILEARKILYIQLREKGLLEKNKMVSFPFVPQRVGLVTSDGSAGYFDFITELKKSGLSFKVVFYPSPMQGKEAVQGVCGAIRHLNSCGEVDLVVITRGGGEKADLLCFDNREIAYAIANSPLPIVTGIGHEIDQTIADYAAYNYFKTPTAVASYLVNGVSQFVGKIEGLKESLNQTVKKTLFKRTNELEGFIRQLSDKVDFLFKTQTASLSNCHRKISSTMDIYLRHKRGKLTNTSQFLKRVCTRLVKFIKYKIHVRQNDLLKYSSVLLERQDLILPNLIPRLKTAAFVFLQRKANKLNDKTRIIDAYDPFRVIKKGFALILGKDRKPVKEVQELEIEKIAEILLRNGIIKAKIKSKEVCHVKGFFRKTQL